PAWESHANDAGRIVGRVGADGRKAGHSCAKGLVALYQCVIAEPKNSTVNIFVNSGDSDTNRVRPSMAIYNGMIDRRPDAIVRCAEVAAAMTAVNFDFY